MNSKYETKPNSIYKFHLSDEMGVFSIDNEFITEETLQKFKEKCCGDYSEFIKFAGKDERSIEELFVDQIDKLDLDEGDAEQYLQINLEDYCPKELSLLVDKYNIEEHDLFSSLFEYTGWEIDGISISDDLGLPHELDVCFVFACELDVNVIVGKIAALTGKGIAEECSEHFDKIIANIKSSYSLSS